VRTIRIAAMFTVSLIACAQCGPKCGFRNLQPMSDPAVLRYETHIEYTNLETGVGARRRRTRRDTS
jgi:hypothetical protein